MTIYKVRYNLDSTWQLRLYIVHDYLDSIWQPRNDMTIYDIYIVHTT